MKKENKPGEYAQESEHEAERATSRQITETRSSPANTACENKTKYYRLRLCDSDFNAHSALKVFSDCSLIALRVL